MARKARSVELPLVETERQAQDAALVAYQGGQATAGRKSSGKSSVEASADHSGESFELAARATASIVIAHKAAP